MEWIGLSNALAWWMVIGSATMVGLAVIAVPMVVARMPADHFVRSSPPRGRRPRRLHVLRWVWLIVKNTLGVACLFFGVLMLVLPGQGVLTILLGIGLLDFPGKFKLQRWVVGRKGVLESLNWFREKAGRPPLVLD